MMPCNRFLYESANYLTDLLLRTFPEQNAQAEIDCRSKMTVQLIAQFIVCRSKIMVKSNGR